MSSNNIRDSLTIINDLSPGSSSSTTSITDQKKQLSSREKSVVADIMKKSSKSPKEKKKKAFPGSPLGFKNKQRVAMVRVQTFEDCDSPDTTTPMKKTLPSININDDDDDNHGDNDNQASEGSSFEASPTKQEDILEGSDDLLAGDKSGPPPSSLMRTSSADDVDAGCDGDDTVDDGEEKTNNNSNQQKSEKERGKVGQRGSPPRSATTSHDNGHDQGDKKKQQQSDDDDTTTTNINDMAKMMSLFAHQQSREEESMIEESMREGDDFDDDPAGGFSSYAPPPTEESKNHQSFHQSFSRRINIFDDEDEYTNFEGYETTSGTKNPPGRASMIIPPRPMSSTGSSSSNLERQQISSSPRTPQQQKPKVGSGGSSHSQRKSFLSIFSSPPSPRDAVAAAFTLHHHAKPSQIRYWKHQRKYYTGMILSTLFGWLYYIRPIHSLGIPFLMMYYSFPTKFIAQSILVMLIVVILIPVQQEKSYWSVMVVGTVLSPILSYFDYDEIIENSPIHIRESIVSNKKRYIFACQPHGVVPFCSIAHSIRQAQIIASEEESRERIRQKRKKSILKKKQKEDPDNDDAMDISNMNASFNGIDVDELNRKTKWKYKLSDPNQLQDDAYDANNSNNGHGDHDDTNEQTNYTVPLYPTAVASQVLFTPVLNHVMGLFQCVAANKSSLKNALQSTCVQLYVGGTSELFETDAETEVLYLSKKKGFIKCALQWGVDVVPVYMFGNTRMYNVMKKPTLLAKISQALQFPITYWYGHNNYFLPIPSGGQEKLLYVSGQPLGMPHVPKPRPAVVNRWHKEYCKQVERIFDQYKERLPHYKHKKLVIK